MASVGSLLLTAPPETTDIVEIAVQLFVYAWNARQLYKLLTS